MDWHASAFARATACSKTIKGIESLVDFLAKRAPVAIPGLRKLVIFSRHDYFDIWFGAVDDGFETIEVVAEFSYDIQGAFPDWRFDFNVLQAGTFPAHDDIAGADHVDVVVHA